MTDARISELENVIGFDLETSGLDEQHDQILELHAKPGRIVAGKFEYHPIGGWEGVSIVLPLSTDVRKWHPTVVEMHIKNGLLVEACAELEARLYGGAGDSASANTEALGEVDGALCQMFPKLKGSATWILLGNSVHFDLRFVRRLLPKFAERLSHRVIDVSAIRIFCESLGLEYTKDEAAHRAADDAAHSIKAFERYWQIASLSLHAIEDLE